MKQEELFPATTKTSMPSEFSKVQNEVGIELTKAEKLAQNYVPFFEEVSALTAQLKSLDKNKPADAEKAKRIKLDFGKLCSRIEDVKKNDKKEHLITGKYIDGLFNVVNGAARLTQKEAEEISLFLLNQQAEIERTIYSQRLAMLNPYLEGAADMALGKLSQSAFDQMYEDAKSKFEAKQKFLERMAKFKKPEPQAQPEETTATKDLTLPSGGHSSTGGFTVKSVSAPFIPKAPEVKKGCKILFFDVETTGTDYRKHSMHQLSGFVEIDGKIVETFDINMQPHPAAEIDKESIAISNKTVEDLQKNQPYSNAYAQFVNMISKYVDRFNSADKMFLCGYNNASFDDHFLRQFFFSNGDKYFGSYFWNDPLDVRVLAATKLRYERSKLENFKLMTVAKYLGLQVDESKLHDATYDVMLTREMFYILENR